MKIINLFNVLRAVDNNANRTQRYLAKTLGFSLENLITVLKN